MKKHRTLLAALLGALALGLAGPALAKHDGYGPPGQAWGHHKHHHHNERGVVYYGPQPVFVRPPPVIVPQPVYYEPAYYYPARRSPSVVIGVDIPPLVIPLR